MTPDQLRTALSNAAVAFRGYNVANLGRTGELLAHARYGPAVEASLREASRIASDALRRPIDLVDRVRRGQETELATYGDAIALLLATEQAQTRILREQFEINLQQARLAYGFSLGEVSALVACGTLTLEDALRAPLAMADDCIALAHGVSLGVLFTRGHELPFDLVHKTCLWVNNQGKGVIGPSAILSPNSYLLLGQGDTLDRFRERLASVMDERIFLKKNESVYPPLHTPIIWERSIPNRVAVLMHTMKSGFTAPKPPILSLVTGKTSYTDSNARELLHKWIDHPQRLWDAVYETMASGIDTVIHMGPAPNIIPATFRRLSENVQSQLKASLGLRAAATMVRRPWLKTLVPARTALLRAPLMRHVILEDWLLEQK